jgi:hypothetical protein
LIEAIPLPGDANLYAADTRKAGDLLAPTEVWQRTQLFIHLFQPSHDAGGAVEIDLVDRVSRT